MPRAGSAETLNLADDMKDEELIDPLIAEMQEVLRQEKNREDDRIIQ